MKCLLPATLALLLCVSGHATAQVVDVTLTAAPGTIQIAPGVSQTGWFYNGQAPGPEIRVPQGSLLRVRFRNWLPERSTIHWHGLPVPFGMDGVPGISRPAVEAGQEFTYEIQCDTPGTFVYHPHVGLQMDRGLYGVVIVDPVPNTDPPASQDITLVLDDWLQGAPINGQIPVHTDWLINGKNSAGQTPIMVTNGETIRLRIANPAAATDFIFAIDGHPMTVTHSDGRPVVPVQVQALPIGSGERYDVYVTANNPGTWSMAASRINQRSQVRVRGILQYAGSTAPLPSATYAPPFLTTGTLLSYSMLAAAIPVTPLATTPNRIHTVTLTGSPSPYQWAMNGNVFPNFVPLPVTFGESVRLDMINQAPMFHPMHLHGHFFRLHGTAGGTTAPPEKDTVLMGGGSASPAGNTISVEFVADNPGNWMYHCHNLYHAHAGMMTTIQYVNGDQDMDGLSDGVDFDPQKPFPVLSSSGLMGGYVLGSTLQLDAQWPMGENVVYFLGEELTNRIDYGPLGILAIWPAYEMGQAVSGVGDQASLTLAIPNTPSLSGYRLPFQAAGNQSLPSQQWRLSTLHFVQLY